jgi:hypothetical protein
MKSFVASIPQPGGTITGFTNFEPSLVYRGTERISSNVLLNALEVGADPIVRQKVAKSEASVDVTGTSPPKPKFERKRDAASEATFHEAATSPVNSAKMRPLAAAEKKPEFSPCPGGVGGTDRDAANALEVGPDPVIRQKVAKR